MTTPEFPISVADLDAGGREYRYTVRPAWVRGVLEGHEATAGQKEGALVVRASKSGADVVVHGTLDSSVSVPCARCLERFELTLHSDLSVLYVPAAKLRAEAEEYEFSAEEADMLPFEGETVALDDLVRDELLLEIPMIPLCSEDCPGMSPSPEADDKSAAGKVTDPRLLPLLQFRVRGKDDKA